MAFLSGIGRLLKRGGSRAAVVTPEVVRPKPSTLNPRFTRPPRPLPERGPLIKPGSLEDSLHPATHPVILARRMELGLESRFIEGPPRVDIPQPLPIKHGNIVGFAGVTRTGKDTASEVLVKQHGYEPLAMSAPMMERALEVNPIMESGQRLSTIVDELGWERAKDEVADVRPLLRSIGDAGRAEYGPDYWTKVALDRADPTKNYVLTGLRMQSEVDKVNEMGGMVLRVNKSNAVVQPGEENIAGMYGVLDIQNDSTIEELHRRVVRRVRNPPPRMNPFGTGHSSARSGLPVRSSAPGSNILR